MALPPGCEALQHPVAAAREGRGPARLPCRHTDLPLLHPGSKGSGHIERARLSVRRVGRPPASCSLLGLPKAKEEGGCNRSSTVRWWWRAVAGAATWYTGAELKLCRAAVSVAQASKRTVQALLGAAEEQVTTREAVQCQLGVRHVRVMNTAQGATACPAV